MLQNLVNPKVITTDVAEILRPPSRITVADCAKDVVRIATPGGYSGNWDPSLTPYMIKPMNMLKSRVYEAVVFAAPARCGKALALDTPIPTPHGWKTMGDLCVGDTIWDERGQQTTVTFTTDIQLNRTCYKVVLSDGSYLIADAEHQWGVERFYWSGQTWRYEVLTTQAMLDHGLIYSKRKNQRKRFRFRVRNAKPLEYTEQSLKIDPYLLGVWLGDGQNVFASISSHIDDAGHYIQHFEQCGHKIDVSKDRENTVSIRIDLRGKLTTHCQRGHDMTVVGKTNAGYCRECQRLTYWRKKYGVDRNGDDIMSAPTMFANTFQSHLLKMKLLCNKHIPREYLAASIEQRYALLRGLMDTDGTFNRRCGTVEFSNTCKPLIDDFCELVRSLGFKPILKQKKTTWTHKGIHKTGTAWRVTFPVSEGRQVFSLPRKADQFQCTKTDVEYRQIIAIEPVESVPVRCIQVDSPSHLYLAGEGMIPTHNTQALLDGWLAHCITADPGDIGFYFSTQTLAYDYRKRRIERLHRNSPRIFEKLSAHAHDTTIEMVTYRNGMILNLGWPTSSQFAQRDLRYVAMSDYDSFPDDISGEGEAFSLAKKRIQVAMSAGMALVESSPKREIISNQFDAVQYEHIAPPVKGGILTLYNRGDRQRWYWLCDRCHEYFEAPAMPAYKDSEYIEEAAASAHVFCANCGYVYYPKDKNRLNANGRWFIEGEIKGKPRKSTIASFWLLGCAAAMQKWESIVANYLMAKKELDFSGDEKALKTTLNTDQGLPYLPLALQENTGRRILESRIEVTDRYFVPEGVRCLLAAVDVQANRFEVLVIGFGQHAERWIIDRFTIKETEAGIPLQPPIFLEHWETLTQRVINSTYRLKNGLELRILHTAVDLGGFHEKKSAGVAHADSTQRAYDWWRHLKTQRLQHRVHLIKGGSSANAPMQKVHYPDASERGTKRASSRGDVPVILINTNRIKDALAVDLQRDVPGAGFIHIPDWLSAKYRNELTAEHRTAKGWDRVGHRRNETLDLMVYTYAIWLHLNGDKINWERLPAWAAWALPLDQNNPELLTVEQRRTLKGQKREQSSQSRSDQSNNESYQSKTFIRRDKRKWLR